MIGFVGSEVVYAVEVEESMNGTEQAIADRIMDEEGYDANIRIHDEAQLEAMQRLGYLAPFIFSEEVDSSVCYYTVEYSPKTVMLDAYANANPTDNDQPLPTSQSFNDRLFSAFYFWESNFTLTLYPTIITQRSVVPHYWDDSCIAIPSPPPKMV